MNLKAKRFGLSNRQCNSCSHNLELKESNEQTKSIFISR